MLIELTRGYKAIIDDASYDIVKDHKWYIYIKHHKNGTILNNYAMTVNSKRGTIFMHRLITSVTKGFEVDHIDGNGLNNSCSNLRICNRSQNAMNNRKQLNTTSIFKGVYWDKRYNKWIASIGINRKIKHLGTFAIEEDAAKAYDKAALELFGEFARPNFK